MTEFDNDLGREISDDEVKLLREIDILREKEPYESLRVKPASDQAGLHPSRGRQIARTWRNDGIVRTPSDTAEIVILTEYGKRMVPELVHRHS